MMLFGANENQHVFKGLVLFLYVYIGASLFAAILTPPAYWLTEWVNATNPNNLTKYLLTKRIDIFYDRLRWLPIVVSLPFLLKYCGLFSFKNLGISFDKNAIKTFVKFCLFGVGSVSAIFVIQHLILGLEIKPDIDFTKIILKSFLGSLILAFLEEIVFRGLLMRCIYTAIGTISAILLSSLFFAYKHFKMPAVAWDSISGAGHSAEWYSGFTVMFYDSIGIAYDFSPVIFANLVILGITLCLFYLKTKSLNSAIGFHFGTVFCMLIFKKTFEHASDKYDLLLGSEWMTDGLLCSTMLCAIMIFALFMKSSTKNG